MKNKRIFVILALLASLLLAGCSTTIKVTVVHDTNGDMETYITVDAQREKLVDEYSEATVLALERWMQINAEARGFIYSANEDEDGYSFYKHTPYLPSDEKSTPSSTTFLFKNYSSLSPSLFNGLIDFVEGYNGNPNQDATDMWGELFYGYRMETLVNEYVQVYEVSGLWDIAQNSSLETDVVNYISEVKLFYEMQNQYTGFYSNADIQVRSMGVAIHRWDLTGNTNRLIQVGQRLPNAGNWYIALIVATGLFLAGSIGIWMILRHKRETTTF